MKTKTLSTAPKPANPRRATRLETYQFVSLLDLANECDRRDALRLVKVRMEGNWHGIATILLGQRHQPSAPSPTGSRNLFQPCKTGYHGRAFLLYETLKNQMFHHES